MDHIFVRENGLGKVGNASIMKHEILVGFERDSPFLDYNPQDIPRYLG